MPRCSGCARAVPAAAGTDDRRRCLLLLATTIARPLGRLTKRASRIAARRSGAVDGRRRADDHDRARRRAMTDGRAPRRGNAPARRRSEPRDEEPARRIRGAAERSATARPTIGGARPLPRHDREDAARLDRLVNRLSRSRAEGDRGVALPSTSRSSPARARPGRGRSPHQSRRAAISDPGRSAQLASAIENLVANATSTPRPLIGAIALASDAPAGCASR
jgi:hypothetical protein